MKYYSEVLYLGFVPVALKGLNGGGGKSYNTKVDCNKPIWCDEGGTKVIQMWFFIGVALHHISDRAKYHVQPPESSGGGTGNKIHKQKYYRVIVLHGLRTRSILPSHRTVSRIISIHLGCQQTCVLGCLIFMSKAITTNQQVKTIFLLGN